MVRLSPLKRRTLYRSRAGREEIFIKLYVAAPIQTAAISIKANNTVSIIAYPADKHLLLSLQPVLPLFSACRYFL